MRPGFFFCCSKAGPDGTRHRPSGRTGASRERIQEGRGIDISTGDEESLRASADVNRTPRWQILAGTSEELAELEESYPSPTSAVRPSKAPLSPHRARQEAVGVQGRTRNGVVTFD